MQCIIPKFMTINTLDKRRWQVFHVSSMYWYFDFIKAFDSIVVVFTKEEHYWPSVILIPLQLLHFIFRSDEPRYNDSNLFMMRKEMVDQKDGVQRMTVKVHMDDMKRVTIREQVRHWWKNEGSNRIGYNFLLIYVNLTDR